MPILLQINVTANWGSHGKIAEEIGKLAISQGYESWIAYGRKSAKSESELIKIGNSFNIGVHGLQSRLLDNHGLSSLNSTKKFIEKIKTIKPDIVHLHNIHGYYINYKILFKYLKEWGGPVVWTLHDCWPFTGHCTHYDFFKCNKWQSHCIDCKQINTYPSSLFYDRSYKNFKDKRESFSGLDNLTIVPVSNWLDSELSQSYLNEYVRKVIHNGIDLETFKPIDIYKNQNSNKNLILGVASTWTQRKGLEEFLNLRKILPDNYNLILVGLSENQIKNLPKGIQGITRTENVNQLVELYNKANVFVNPTLEDTFPTTNLESLACGTPIITYDTGGSPEAIDSQTGVIVKPKDLQTLAKSIIETCDLKPFSAIDCRKRAELLFDKNKNYIAYIELYNSLLGKIKK